MKYIFALVGESRFTLHYMEQETRNMSLQRACNACKTDFP